VNGCNEVCADCCKSTAICRCTNEGCCLAGKCQLGKICCEAECKSDARAPCNAAASGAANGGMFWSAAMVGIAAAAGATWFFMKQQRND